MMILDDGYQFGLGIFETIAVVDGVPLFLKQHLKRLAKALEFLKIEQKITSAKVFAYLENNRVTTGGLKIMVSQENIIFLPRENPYQNRPAQEGAVLAFSEIRRNEHSPFTYHKTLNYGECIIENKKAKARGLDEMIFLNSKGQICEGTVSNIFFVKNGRIHTPQQTCGLLPGIVREFVMGKADVLETVIYEQDLKSFDECFITNSLMGIMAVSQLGSHNFSKNDQTRKMMAMYRHELQRQVGLLEGKRK